MNEDLQTLTGLVQRYETIRSNYNFSNEQLFEMNRIEGNVVAIIGKYLKESQINVVVDFINKIPGLLKVIPQELMVLIEPAVEQLKKQTEQKFYSFDGQAFDTLEEAQARNNQITMGGVDAPSGRAF